MKLSQWRRFSFYSYTKDKIFSIALAPFGNTSMRRPWGWAQSTECVLCYRYQNLHETGCPALGHVKTVTNNSISLKYSFASLRTFKFHIYTFTFRLWYSALHIAYRICTKWPPRLGRNYEYEFRDYNTAQRSRNGWDIEVEFGGGGGWK